VSELDVATSTAFLHLRSVLAVLAIALLAAVGWMWYCTTAAIDRGRITLAPSGTTERGRALIVVHPGFTDFTDRVARAFGEGLSEAGWRVELTTASSNAPTDLSGLDLLVLTAPVYWYAPALPIQRYVRRLGGLGGKAVAILLTAAVSGDRALRVAERLVTDAHGSPVTTRLFFTWRQNPGPESGKRSTRAAALELAYRAGHAMRSGTHPR
jgi:hypothetical protein